MGKIRRRTASDKLLRYVCKYPKLQKILHDEALSCRPKRITFLLISSLTAFVRLTILILWLLHFR